MAATVSYGSPLDMAKAFAINLAVPKPKTQGSCVIVMSPLHALSRGFSCSEKSAIWSILKLTVDCKKNCKHYQTISRHHLFITVFSCACVVIPCIFAPFIFCMLVFYGQSIKKQCACACNQQQASFSLFPSRPVAEASIYMYIYLFYELYMYIVHVIACMHIPSSSLVLRLSARWYRLFARRNIVICLKLCESKPDGPLTSFSRSSFLRASFSSSVNRMSTFKNYYQRKYSMPTSCLFKRASANCMGQLEPIIQKILATQVPIQDWPNEASKMVEMKTSNTYKSVSQLIFS